MQHTLDTPPENSFSDNSGGKKFYTYAPGHGQSYGYSGGYGGRGMGCSANPPRGLSYGYEAAPFMSGSPVGTYNGNLDYPAPGSVVLFVNGHAKIDGTISAAETGTKRGHGSNSGGGVWLCAATFEASTSASITAGGGTCGNYNSAGAGGRIALGLGLLPSDIEALAGGTEVSAIEGLTKVNAYGFRCEAPGGIGMNGTGNHAEAGTAVVVYRSANAVISSVSSVPANTGTANPAYGFYAFATGSVPEFTGPAPGFIDGWRNMRKFTAVNREDASADQPGVVWNFGGDKMLCRVRIYGEGTVSFGGSDYTDDFEFWADSGSAVSLSAGAGFSAWYGDIPGGKSSNAAISPTLSAPLVLHAVFNGAEGNSLSYTGAANGYWDDVANWSPALIPGPLDDVTIPSGKTVRGVNTLAVNSLTVAGSLALGGMSANATTAQQLTDIKGGFSGLYVEEGLGLSGFLTLGSRSQTAPVTASYVGGDLSLSGSGKLSVYAGFNGYPLSGTFREIYEDHLVFDIGGNFTVADNATVYPVADSLSGTPVEWKTSGNFTLAAGAKIDCTNLGFDWSSIEDSRYREKGKVGGEIKYTLSPGLPVRGPGFDFGANYGGENASAISSKYSAPYGNRYAPFMPGSSSSSYNGQTTAAGGGTAWIWARGEMNLEGKILADGPRPNNYSGPSGGSIWLLARKVSAAATAKLSAEGGKNPHSTLWASGSGGRISLAVGMKDEDIAAIVAGTAPADLQGVSVVEDITIVDYSVRGGPEATKNAQGATQYGPSGTATTLSGAAADTVVLVTATPVEVAGITYGPVQKPQGETAVFTAPAIGYVAGEENSVRYTLLGWVCSNSTEQVASGDSATAEIAVGREPLTLTWLWGNRETLASAVASDTALGSVTVNGSVSDAGTVWAGADSDVTFAAVPEEGCEFLYWVGDTPFGKAEENPLVFKGGAVRSVKAIFRESAAPCTRTWAGSGDNAGDFLDASKWSPAGIPGTDDHVVIANGSVFATNTVVCGSLEISGSAIVRLAAYTQYAAYNRKNVNATPNVESNGSNLNCDNYTKPFNAPDMEEAYLRVKGDFTMSGNGQISVGAKDQLYRSTLKVGGNLLMNETNKILVAAGLADETFTFARGAGFVEVGGKLLVGGESGLYLLSEGYTGGSVVVRAGRFEVEEGAVVDAVNSGWRFYEDRIPNTLAPGYGYDYTIGGGYGGYGLRFDADKSYADWSTYGLPYGQEYAPVHPGSCKGSYGEKTRRGGGLIRVHAKSVKIFGTLNASAAVNNLATTISGGSGGGIWVTSAGSIKVGPNAKFLARGGYRVYSTGNAGGGGRIALCESVSEADVEELASTGSLAARRMPDADESAEFFAGRYPGAAYDVRCGETEFPSNRPYLPRYDGTFRYLKGRGGLTLMLK